MLCDCFHTSYPLNACESFRYFYISGRFFWSQTTWQLILWQDSCLRIHRLNLRADESHVLMVGVRWTWDARHHVLLNVLSFLIGTTSLPSRVSFRNWDKGEIESVTVAMSSCSGPPLKRISGWNVPCGSDALAQWIISLALPSSNILHPFFLFRRKPKSEQPESSPENPFSLISVINQTDLQNVHTLTLYWKKNHIW